ncbi:MAG: hypothetical protein IKF16_04140 [Lachnospiraceae bacterium]|nr:hypothetical protein [Lachnospiraceae bacterium]
MSVEKVNAYKEKKTHRKENLAKEKSRKKRNSLLTKGVAALCAAAVVAAIGFTGYSQYKAYEDALPDYNVTSQVVSDYAGVTETEAADTAEEADAAAEADEEAEAGEEAESAAE